MREWIAHPHCSVFGETCDILADARIRVLAAKTLGLDAGSAQLDDGFFTFHVTTPRSVAAGLRQREVYGVVVNI
jgi:hypothetical protein